MKFKNHTDAGLQLADILRKKFNTDQNIIVIALPRGGVPVAYQVARKFKAPLDLAVTRKLGAPYNPEFGFGAIAPDNIMVLNNESVNALQLSEDEIREIAEKEIQEMNRRIKKYRGTEESPDVESKTAIIVDDGAATGATAIAAIEYIKRLNPKKIVAAFPVCSKESAEEIKEIVDEFICIHQPEEFNAVGEWYENFAQVTDDQVIELMEQNNNALYY